MCSFLLLFLILIVVFTNLQDFAQATIGNVETQGSASKSFGKKTVVLAQDWQSIFDSSIIDPCQTFGFQASLQIQFLEQNFSRDSSENVRGRGISLRLLVPCGRLNRKMQTNVPSVGVIGRKAPNTMSLPK